MVGSFTLAGLWLGSTLPLIDRFEEGARIHSQALSEAELMHSRIKGSHLEVIPSAGHLPNLEQPGEFNQAVTRFLHSLD